MYLNHHSIVHVQQRLSCHPHNESIPLSQLLGFSLEDLPNHLFLLQYEDLGFRKLQSKREDRLQFLGEL